MSSLYNRFFTRGYLLASRTVEHSVTDGWRLIRLGGLYLYSEPLTEIDIAVSPYSKSATVVIVGMSIDLEAEVGSSTMNAGRAAAAFSSGGEEEFLRYIAYLGGRFIAILVTESDQVLIVPDCHATYACYIHQSTRSDFFASSHSNLLGQIMGLVPNEEARRIMNHPDYNEPGGKYYPASLTPYADVSPLFPNCFVRWKGGQSFLHRRFYPFEDLALPASERDAVSQFDRNFERHLKRISSFRRIGISLTGGLDSRVTVAGLLQVTDLSNHFSFTYYRPTPSGAMSGDLFAGSWLAAQIGMQHQVVHLQPVDYSCEFHRMYQVSFGRGARHPALARAYFEQLPLDFVSLISLGSETGTMFYRDRRCDQASAAVLASKFTTSAVKNDQGLIKSFDEYIEYSEFYVDRFQELDFYDLFYWEHRNAKWAALWYSEADLAHFTVVPFNQRGIIEAMLSLPESARSERAILTSYLTRNLGSLHESLQAIQQSKHWED